ASGLGSRWLERDGTGTIVKTRILAGSSHTSRQQIVRLDRGHPAARAGDKGGLTRSVAKALRGARGALLSDYGYGVLDARIRTEALRIARKGSIPVVVDSRYALRGYRGATLLTPNEHEIQSAFHLPSLDLRGLKSAGEKLRRAASADAVWVTRGSDGML